MKQKIARYAYLALRDGAMGTDSILRYVSRKLPTLIGKQTVRNALIFLSEKGYVKIIKIGSSNSYTIIREAKTMSDFSL